MRVLQYNLDTSSGAVSQDWDKEQQDYFGRSAVIVYVEGATNADTHIYLGGSANVETVQHSDARKWGLGIFHLNYLGEKVELWSLKDSDVWGTDDSNYAYIDHMKMSSN